MSRQKNLKRNLLICLLAGSAVMYTLPLHAATSVVANNALPQGGQFMGGSSGKFDYNNNGLELNVHQNDQNAVIKWGSFDVGGSATVNFTAADAFKNNFNTLNYVNSGSASQIYGTINGLGCNIYVVNTAGVQIGPSAQINVGSLYVSNNVLDDSVFNNFVANANNANFNLGGKPTTYTDAALMSLGNINANNVTFEGNGRIVIDSERLINGNNSMGAANINIETAANNTGNIVIGYDAYDETTDSYNTAGTTAIAKVNGQDFAQNKGYMWVEDVEQLQAIDTNLSGNYALRNSIDATATKNWNNDKGFSSIGVDAIGKTNGTGFTGKFDGIDYNIFGLTIDRDDETNVGLFGAATDATINNVTLVGGSINGSSNVGAIVGAAERTTICNVTNSAKVEGNNNVGGIVGIADNTTVENAINTGIVDAAGYNIGGLIGYMYNSNLGGNSYNLGDVSSELENVGGLVGHAVNSTIGDGTNLVYNRLDVEGAYNVGGIVGNMEGTTVQNAENSGRVLARGYTTEGYTYHTGVRNSGSLPSGTLNVDDGTVTTTVNIANAGGIAGTSSDSEIVKVTNTADVSTATETGTQYTVNDLIYYTAGNVGGIVGRAEDTNISDATNRENEMRGAHNVGGVAGYFGGTGTVSGGINDGGDIMATGARYNDNFVRELIRPVGDSNESFIIGNIGGVVGYMDGDNVYVTGSANRGTVHSQDIEEENATNVLYTSQAANVGGVVGKIDRSDTKGLVEIKNNTSLAAVNNSYNTGDVRGYTGVGGVVGMMYNGEVASSYNLGYLRTTRIATNGENIEAVNMGGIVGDTTEGSRSKGVIIYDVYNKGQIGDDTYTYYARHVAGIVGRLSGTVEKAYNNGEIYNGYTATGGIAGWMYEGSINNAFNTGNITVYNHDSSTSQVGGIVGAASVASGDINLTNVYNLGTLRSFQANSTYAVLNHNVGANSVAGIIGAVMNNRHDLIIENAYTTGNIYAGNQDDSGNIYLDRDNKMVGSIYGENRGVKNDNTGPMEYADIKRTNTYYIRPEDGVGFTQLGTNNYGSDNSNKGIDYEDRDNVNENENVYSYYDNGWYSLNFSSQSGGNVTGNTDNNWRLYPDGTPILNAFLPDSESYFDKYNNNTDLVNAGMDSVQYGTAYDPLLTIITANNNANGNLSFTLGAGDNELSISNAAGLVVYNAGLTLNNFSSSGSSSGYYGGLIYSDGVLTINAADNEGLAFGSGADIYGSSVALNADGTITIYGDVTATGNGTAANDDPDKAGSINIASNDSDINVYGTLTSATAGESVTIPGISGAPDSNWRPVDTGDSISDPSDNLNTIGERYEHTTTASAVNGNITIEAGTWTDADKDGIQDAGEVTGGNIGLYYGNKGEGITTTGGDLTVTGTGDVYVDSDLDIGGNLTLNGTGADSEVVLDITNIGEVQEKNDNTDKDNSTDYLHDFLEHFANTTNNSISFGDTQDAKITVDMWNGNTLDLTKFNNGSTSLVAQLGKLHITDAGTKTAQQLTHIWVSNGEQLKGIQIAANSNDDVLSYNFALKNDINASDVKDYVAIGTGSEFTGTFDGRGNRIIGLTVDGKDTANAGIFDTIGTNGVVKDVNIYSGNFTGTAKAGAVAGENNGRIEGVKTFGNTVKSDGNAGGIVGVNNSGTFTNEDGTTNGGELTGGIYDVESTGSVIAGSNSANAGGLVGTNGGALGNSFSDSAVTVQTGVSLGASAGLGGVVGVNNGDVQIVDSLGVTNGGDTSSSNIGGIIGINNGNMYSGYNESIVSGSSNVGGIIGDNSSTVANVVNATSVTGKDKDKDNVSEYVGGLVGTNTGSVTNGRNNGTITGTKYVGGLVGNNADENSILTNLVNDSSAEILGEEYVGGIAGSNSGTITADEKNDNLVNRGSITGVQYVGGITGENKGTITNTNNDVELFVNTDKVTADKQAQYFGGVAGINQFGGIIKDATNTADVNAYGATYVGGVVGKNDGTLQDMAGNSGNVTGKNFVGGVAGQNNIALDGVNASNDGVVKATEGGAGGIFAENNADIINSTLTNNKIVAGGAHTGATGGIIGKNSGDITKTSLKNEVNGQVIGMNNVGGLIGENTGKIEGGRDDADSYYKYQIYNNGVINVGTWTDNDGDGIVDAGEIQGLAEGATSTNIGGLIGNNTTENGKTGSLTAGYNTGAINASGSTNVGGIAGSNAGTIGEVFNTVYNTDGTKGAITGGTNVGGLVGNNSGILSNAYNTTDVSGNYAGNAVGNNTAKGTIKNIYASNNSGKLIGENINQSVDAIQNAYSFVNGDTSATKIISGEDQKDSGSYDGFDFSAADVDGDAADWKNYDGYSNPLLKVFLTKAKYTGNESFTYNGQDQGLTINSNTITAADKLDAYNNANSLLTATQNKNAGEGYLGIYSQQIATSGKGDTFDPNNLGYDIDVTYDIKKKQLNITLDDVHRVYGNVAITQGGYQISNIDGWQGSDKDLANGITISPANDKGSFEQTDTALTGSNTGKVTENAGGQYTWSADVTLSEEIAQNYEITTTTLTGNSYVGKAKLTININDVTMTYGDKESTISNQYGYTVNNGLVNGDSLKDVIADMTYENTAYNTDGTTKDVIDGKYALQDKDVTGGSKYGNYEITINDGEVTMGKAQLVVDINNVDMTYGDKESTISNQYGYTVNNGLVNEDSLKDVIADMTYENTAYNTDGTTKDVIDGKYALQDKDVTGGSKYGNYEITINDGEVTMGKAQLVVDINNVDMTYGDKESTISNQYGYTVNNGLVNEDSLKDVIADMTYENTAYNTDGTTKDVIDGKYALENKDITVGGKYGNYEVTINNGTVMMNKADLNIKVDNANTTVGKMPSELTGTVEGLTNGDTLPTHDFALKDDSFISVSGNHENVIGIVIGGKFYELGDADWSNGLFANYDVNYEMGDLAVSVVEIPDNWPNNRWDYLFGDNPFDRNENFRERKAEVNFVDGAMEI